jgi:branched-chain amino acid transport system permease protein
MRCGDFKENYIKDEEIFQSRFVKLWLALFFIFLMVFPFIANAHMLYIANMIGLAVIGAIGLNLLTGFTGQISLGHAAFIGVGAYTSAILITKYGVSFWLSIPLAGLVSALAGIVIGIPSLRVKGLYLCIATLAAQFIFGFIFVHWESMTKGITGIHIPPPRIGSLQFDTEKTFYWITIAIRSVSAGVSGALWVSFLKVVIPEHFNFMLCIQYLAMVIVGGLGSVIGSIFGAIFMTLVPEILNVLSDVVKSYAPGMGKLIIPFKQVVFGFLIVSFLIFEPRGLAEIWNRIKKFFTLWPFSY